MAYHRQTAQDRRDFDKFTKFFVLKSVQVLVQSRLGEKINMKSKPSVSGTDWFNLAIRDVSEVTAEAKKALGGHLPSDGNPVCIEFSLKTEDGESMVLETWCLSVTEESDPNVRVSYTAYNRMGLLLKSLICVSRTTPAYHLSRRQSIDSYVICYRIYLGEPQLQSLGDGAENVRVGGVITPLGTIQASVSCRTKLTLSPQRLNKSFPVAVKDDYFQQDNQRIFHENGTYANGRSPPEKKAQGFEEEKDVFAIRKVGAFANDSLSSMSSQIFMQESPMLLLLSKGDSSSMSTKTGGSDTSCSDAVMKSDNEGEEHVPGATKPQCIPKRKETQLNHILKHVTTRSPTLSDRMSIASDSPPPDDFVMVELNPPFGTTDASKDLGAFYRMCQSRPPLLAFSDPVSLKEEVENLEEQLKSFELEQSEFNEFVHTLCSGREEATVWHARVT